MAHLYGKPHSQPGLQYSVLTSKLANKVPNNRQLGQPFIKQEQISRNINDTKGLNLDIQQSRVTELGKVVKTTFMGTESSDDKQITSGVIDIQVNTRESARAKNNLISSKQQLKTNPNSQYFNRNSEVSNDFEQLQQIYFNFNKTMVKVPKNNLPFRSNTSFKQ